MITIHCTRGVASLNHRLRRCKAFGLELQVHLVPLCAIVKPTYLAHETIPRWSVACLLGSLLLHGVMALQSDKVSRLFRRGPVGGCSMTYPPKRRAAPAARPSQHQWRPLI